jgi:hypothetical protein
LNSTNFSKIQQCVLKIESKMINSSNDTFEPYCFWLQSESLLSVHCCFLIVDCGLPSCSTTCNSWCERRIRQFPSNKMQ